MTRYRFGDPDLWRRVNLDEVDVSCARCRATPLGRFHLATTATRRSSVAAAVVIGFTAASGSSSEEMVDGRRRCSAAGGPS
jgi:hypothetical protein